MFSCEFFFSNFVLSKAGFTKIIKSKLKFLTYIEAKTKNLSLLGLLLVKMQNKYLYQVFSNKIYVTFYILS